MTVLMFGWEFPPNISGGLGTACQGLTEALIKEEANVLFVVPKLFGDETSEGVQLISASEVVVPFPKYAESENLPGRLATKDIRKGLMIETRNQITTIQIPSTLTPYTSPESECTIRQLEQWNHPYSRSTATITIKANVNTSEVLTVDQPPSTFSFSGGYGATLMEEVSRYAQVASTLPEHYSFDVIHAHDWMTYPAGIEAKKKSEKPLVIHVHATEYDRASRVNEAVYAIEKEGMEKADRIIAVSGWTRKIIIERYRIPAQKIEVVHNGVMKEESHEINRPAFAPIGSHIVTFLGRITHQKGPVYFVEAARKVIQQFPDVHFVMAGSGDLFPQIIERVAQLKLSSHFHFTGFLKKKQIDQILSFTHVYVMPSVSEPFGITPLEAIRAGVPVIISNQSGVAEVMPHALKVDFWNSDALANAICSVLKYESLSTSLKNNSVKEIKNITWKRAAKKINKIYYELTQNNVT